MITINDKGLNAIAAWLREHHKRGGSLTADNISVWATEAEDHYYEHGEAYIEIRSADSMRGQTQTLTLSQDAYDVMPDDVE